MTIVRRAIKYLPALLAFGCVLGGSLLLLPRDQDTAGAQPLVGVVVLSRDMAEGTPADEVRGAAELRQLPREAVPEGSLDSLNDITGGVLAVDHVAGQQLTAHSFARNRVAAVGADFLVVSVRLPAQSWTGAFRIAGDVVDVYALSDDDASLVSSDAVVLDSPPLDEVQPSTDSVITLAVRRATLPAVLLAAREERLWLVGK
jgi:hypothetical protein